MSGFAIVIIVNLKSYSEDKAHSYSSFPYEAYKNLFQNIYHSCAVLASHAGLRGAKILNEDEDCVCVCMCVCGHVYVVYEDTNLYNDMGMT